MDEKSGIPTWLTVDVTMIVAALVIIGLGIWIGL